MVEGDGMSAPAVTEATPYAIVSDAWQVYRRSQEIPFPADPGDLMKAQSRLFTLAEPFASGRVPLAMADLLAGEDVVAALVEAIEDAADALVASIEWHCGTEAASFVAGDGEGRRAA
jgi:hypothetical protein